MNVSNTFYDFIISFNGHPLQLKLVLPKLSTWIESYWHLMFSSIKTPTSMKYNLGNLWKWQCLRKREKNVLVQIPPMDSFLVFQPNLLEICPPPLWNPSDNLQSKEDLELCDWLGLCRNVALSTGMSSVTLGGRLLHLIPPQYIPVCRDDTGGG